MGGGVVLAPWWPFCRARVVVAVTMMADLGRLFACLASRLQREREPKILAVSRGRRRTARTRTWLLGARVHLGQDHGLEGSFIIRAASSRGRRGRYDD